MPYECAAGSLAYSFAGCPPVLLVFHLTHRGPDEANFLSRAFSKMAARLFNLFLLQVRLQWGRGEGGCVGVREGGGRVCRGWGIKPKVA